MSLEDTLETFGYLITEANKLGLAYITLARYSPALAPSFDGGSPTLTYILELY